MKAEKVIKLNKIQPSKMKYTVKHFNAQCFAQPVTKQRNYQCNQDQLKIVFIDGNRVKFFQPENYRVDVFFQSPIQLGKKIF